MPSYVTPGLYFETVDNAREDIDACRVDIPAFIGIASRGPLHTPTQINSQAQFQEIFGGFMLNSYLAYVVKAFFENGGTRCSVVRVATSDATCARASVPDEVNGTALCITASSPGLWGNDLSLFLAPANAFSTQMDLTVPQPQDRSSLFLTESTGLTVGMSVKVFQQPIIASMVIKALHDRNMVTFNAPLGSDFDLSRPIHLETAEFALTVYLAGQLSELFPRLSLIAESAHYIENVLKQTSQFIRATVKSGQVPDINKIKGSVKLRCGKDGLATLSLEDMLGDSTTNIKRGLRTLEDVPEVASVAMPDLTLQPTPAVQHRPLPQSSPNPCSPTAPSMPLSASSVAQTSDQFPGFSPQEVLRAQQAMVNHCEQQKDRIAILDPPTHPNGDVFHVAEIRNWRQNFNSKYAALYYPQLLVYNPSKLDGQLVRAIPPCGHVAGMYARIDAESGPHRAPANEELSWVQGTSIEITGPIQGDLNPVGINCIRTFPGRGIRIYGARTLSSQPAWIYVNVRRFMLMLERTLEVTNQWAVFEPNDDRLQQALRLGMTTLLERQWQLGALVGAKPADAFFLKFNAQVNLGQLIIEVGVAPSRPAEFLVFRVSRTQETFEITE